MKFFKLNAAGFIVFSGMSLLTGAHAETAPKPVPRAPAAPAAPVAASGPRVVKTETQAFDFWTVACDTLSEPAGHRRCVARLPVFKTDSQQLIVVLTAVAVEPGQNQLLIQLPTSILVQPGGALAVQGGEERKFAIQSCLPALCTGVIPLDAALSSQLSKASAASLSWTAIGGNAVKVDFAMKGSAGALSAALVQ